MLTVTIILLIIIIIIIILESERSSLWLVVRVQMFEIVNGFINNL